MKLYGTMTSPYVRRVRVIAAEVGEPVELVNTATPEGEAELRAVSPIWKVPVAIVEPAVAGGTLIYDSRAIIEWLTTTHGWGELTPSRGRWRDQNLLNAIDGALDSVIQLFYLRRENVPVDGTPYATHNLARTDAIFAWLGTQLAADKSGFGEGIGLLEISLIAVLDWMDFRKSYPTERAAAVESVRVAWRDRPSLSATRPHA